MARRTDRNLKAVYRAAERWVDVALRDNNSLFTPDKPIWSAETLNDFYGRFVANPEDDSADSFGVKLGRQLDGAPPETSQLAAEALYVHFLIASSIRGETKRKQITDVLDRTGLNIQIPSDLNETLDLGIVSVGSAFNTRRDAQIRLIVEFARHWKTLREERRSECLQDPWAMKEEVFAINFPFSGPQAAALLHMIYPETFEAMVSNERKQRITRELSHLIESPSGDLDRDLLAIRQQLQERFGEEFQFHYPAVLELWEPDPSKWGQFIRWARRLIDYPGFDQDERDYKLESAAHLQAARAAVKSGEEGWGDDLQRAFGPPNNLTSWRAHGTLLKWFKEQPREGATALENIWSGETPVEESIRAFLKRVPNDVVSGPGTRVNLASFLATAIDPEKFPTYQHTAFRAGYALTDHPPPDPDADEAAIYTHALAFLDTLAKEGAKRGLDLRDRLDAQSVLWSVVKSGQYEDVLPPDDHAAFLWYRNQGPEEAATETDGVPEKHPDSLEKLAQELLFDVSDLRRIERLLADKRQIVFYGPPGTGKTYVAQQLATHFAGARGETDLVQFHPSYAYEDFVEGYRPADIGGQPGFRLRPGPLKRIAQRAAAEPSERHILVIDEVNRGNVAKVFGELYFLLEYRDREVSLQYSDDRFVLPENLWFIATMNSADRSIALVDSALRRRFHFAPFFPDEPPVEGLLRRWLSAHKPDLLWVADAVDRANTLLDDRQVAIGPSHFLRPDLDVEWVDLIWQHSIMPYIAEQLFGEADRLEDFTLEKIRGVSEDADPAIESTNNAPPDTS